MRVHALARELEMTHHELLRVIEGAPRDIPADSMMSQLTDEDVAYLRLGVAQGFPQESAKEAPVSLFEQQRQAKEAREKAAAASKKSSRKKAAPTLSPHDERVRDMIKAYHAFWAQHAAAPVPEPMSDATLFPGGPHIAYADPGPLTRAVLERRDAAVAMLHEPQYVLQEYLFGAVLIDGSDDTLGALRAGDPELLQTLRSNLPSYFQRFGINWDYFHRFTHAYAPHDDSEVQQTHWSQARARFMMRDDIDAAMGERTYEYDDDARFARWRQDPSTIDIAWALQEYAAGIALSHCLAHEIERAEDVLLDTLQRHLLGGQDDGPVTHITLLEDNENVRYQFYVTVGPVGAAFSLRCWEL